MANITLLGASYTDVPAVDLPQTGGGTVRFYEGSVDTNTTYTLSISGNVITLTGSDGQTSSVTLPVYNGGVS